MIVVVPCFNHGNYLRQSVESILNQTWKNLSVVIVNDGSSDSTHEIGTELLTLDRVEYISLEDNFGKWRALNTAIERFDSDYVTAQDADDVSLSDRIERQVTSLRETQTLHNLCGFYHCWSEDEVDAHKNERVSGDLNTIMSNDVHQMVLAGYKQPGINHYFTGEFETAGVTALFDRRLWELGLRFNPPGVGLRVLNSEDSDFNFRATTLLGRTSILVEKLYCYRRGTSTNNEST